MKKHHYFCGDCSRKKRKKEIIIFSFSHTFTLPNREMLKELNAHLKTDQRSDWQNKTRDV